MPIETLNKRISSERTGEVSIGRIIIPVVIPTRWEPGTTFHRFFNALNGTYQQQEEPKGEGLRGSFTRSLNNNTPYKHPRVAYERPVSAYFTYNPQDEAVIIEWGTIDPTNGNAKLHTYLNQVINYAERVRQGMKLTSGHIARVDTENDIYVALLDNLPAADTPLSRYDPMGKLINTLHFSGFIPITADGFVRLPIF